jgi:hypothetical protein
MKKLIFNVLIILMIVLLFAACADDSIVENSSVESISETASQPDTPESSTAALPQTNPLDDPQYEMLYNAMHDLRWYHTVISLDSMLSQFDNYVLRDELAYPYVKVHLQNGFVGFLFYNESSNLTDIWLTDHFLTQQDIDRLAVGKTTTREVILMNLYAIRLHISSENISANYLTDGVYVIRCSYDGSEGIGVITSMEFIPNEEFHEEPVERYQMTIPYILPCDRNMD